MTAWWGRERATEKSEGPPRHLVCGEFGLKPNLIDETAAEVAQELFDRRAAYTPDWVDPQQTDAGSTLVKLFGDQAAPVRRRLNRLPDKVLVDFFRIAGIQPEPARPSVAMVRFSISPGAEGSTLVPGGFQLGATPADDSSDMVIFETQSDLRATPAELTELIVQEGANLRNVLEDNKDPEQSFAPFGGDPRVGNALLIGLGEETTERPAPSVSFGIRIAATPGSPPPVSLGGVAPIPLPVAPVLQWEALIGGRFELVDELEDETRNLFRSGTITLRTPRNWKTYPLNDGGEKRFWLRLQIVHGRFAEAPRISSIRTNMVAVRAVQTVRDEVLEAVDELGAVIPDSVAASALDPQSADGTKRMQVAKTPVVPKSLVIKVDTTPLDDRDDTEMKWSETSDLATAGPDDRVFLLDPSTGIVTFGDGVNGAAIPLGFRNVRALRYETGGGRAGAVDADQITTLLNSAPFITEVTNPLPAAGGTNEQNQRDAIRRGAGTLRARGRAVTVADYAMLARAAEGADIHRAHAISGFHPRFPDQRTPGVVGVLVVPRLKQTDTGPPIPDETELRQVARHLTENVAPAGVEVVASAPRYRKIRTQVEFVGDPTADVGLIVRELMRSLDKYLHPITGGDKGQGWLFGQTLVHSELVLHLVSSVKGVRAISVLRTIVDGVPQRACSDVRLQPDQLFWPVGTSAFPFEQEGSS